MGSKFIEQKYYVEKINTLERERESNNQFETLSLRIRCKTIR